MHLVIDAANVVGSRPDGWWRDRAGAARRLMDSVAAAVAAVSLDPPVTMVLEGAARAGVPAGPVPVDGRGALEVVHAERDGDSAIVALVERLVTTDPDVVVVTADRGLRDRVTALGAQVVGPIWLRDHL